MCHYWEGCIRLAGCAVKTIIFILPFLRLNLRCVYILFVWILFLFSATHLFQTRFKINKNMAHYFSHDINNTHLIFTAHILSRFFILKNVIFVPLSHLQILVGYSSSSAWLCPVPFILISYSPYSPSSLNWNHLCNDSCMIFSSSTWFFSSASVLRSLLLHWLFFNSFSLPLRDLIGKSISIYLLNYFN